MTATPRKASASVQHGSPVPNIEDEIRRRAYELYEERGQEDGRDVEDWLRAEKEIKQARSLSVAA